MYTIHQLSVSCADNFLYVIADDASQQALLVDPAWDASALLHFLTENHLQLAGILLTHTHHDHINAVDDILQATDATLPVYLSAAEFAVGRLARRTNLGSTINVQYLADGQTISLGHNTQITAIATPGHTAGALCYGINSTGQATFSELITGDTLFIYGCGRCDFADSDVEAMFASLQKLKTLPATTRVYSGHDYGCEQVTSLGEQMAGNPFLMIGDLADFVRYRMQLHGQYRRMPYAPVRKKDLAQVLLRVAT